MAAAATGLNQASGELRQNLREICSWIGYRSVRQRRSLHVGFAIVRLPGPSQRQFSGGATPLGDHVHRRLDDVFYETLARDFLQRGEPEILWQLRLDAIEARRRGHQRGADLLTEIADAAERLLQQTKVSK